MRHLPRFAAVLVLCGALAACSSSPISSPAPTTAPTTTTGSGASIGGGATTAPVSGGGATDCAALKEAVGAMIVNWQVVLGLANVDVADWASTPVGSLSKFGDQLKVMSAALGSDADAAASLKFMTGANDIVQRGVGGDANAKADLAKYLGTDLTANVKQQLPISLAFAKSGCQ